MSRPWDDFLPLVLPDVPGCPEALALAAVKRGAIELCRSAYVWVRDLGPLDVIAGQAEYACPPPAGAAPVITLGLAVRGLPLRAATVEELDLNHPGWPGLSAARPLRFLVPTLGKVRLVPEPSENIESALVVRMVLAPAHDAAAAEDLLLDQWAVAVAHAAKAELMLVPGKPWTQPQLAEHHQRQFAAHVARARGRASAGWTATALTARPRAFGG